MAKEVSELTEKTVPSNDDWLHVQLNAGGAGTDRKMQFQNVMKGIVNAQTGTTYTTQNSDIGKIITLNNGSAITLTVHASAPVGFHCTIIQKGVGQVTVAAGGSGNVRNFNGHSQLAGQYAIGSIIVESNAGSAPEVYFNGVTA